MMEEVRPTKKIGLLGPFGYGNLGDAAIQDAMIQHIRKRFPEAVIYGYSLNPEDTQARHGIRSFPISRISKARKEQGQNHRSLSDRFTDKVKSSSHPAIRNLERWIARVPIELKLTINAFKALNGLDALIISGGGQLDDYWGGGGPWSQPYILLKWSVLAKLRKSRLLFVSVGAGPIDAWLSKIFIRCALSLADFRSFRDHCSKGLIESIGFHQDDPIYPDLAHSLQITEFPPNRQLKKSGQIVGIGPIGYFKQGCWPEYDEAIYSDYLAKMASFVSWLIQKQYSISFLPGEAHFDLLAINDLMKVLHESGTLLQEGHQIDSRILTVDDLLTQLALADFVVASRFHNVLLAQLLGKPVLALSYQAKIEALMSDTGQEEYCFQVSQFNLEHLKEAFTGLEANFKTISIQVTERAQAYREALDEQYERIFTLI